MSQRPCDSNHVYRIFFSFHFCSGSFRSETHAWRKNLPPTAPASVGPRFGGHGSPHPGIRPSAERRGAQRQISDAALCYRPPPSPTIQPPRDPRARAGARGVPGCLASGRSVSREDGRVRRVVGGLVREAPSRGSDSRVEDCGLPRPGTWMASVGDGGPVMGGRGVPGHCAAVNTLMTEGDRGGQLCPQHATAPQRPPSVPSAFPQR